MRRKLIEFRGERSQQEMAETYNVTQQSWSKWERGEGFPRAPLMLRLERDSGILVRDLFFDNNDNLLLLKEGGNGGVNHGKDDCSHSEVSKNVSYEAS